MAISAQRFKLLDQETNIPVIDFAKLTDNAAYNTLKEIEGFVPEAMSKMKGLLDKLTSGIKKLAEAIKNGIKGVIDKIKGIVSGILDKLSKLGLPSFLKDLFKFISSLDLFGFTNYLKEALKPGAMSFCNNMDFLGIAGGAYLLTDDILAGIMVALTMSWVDRKCKAMSRDEQNSLTGKQLIEEMIPYTGEPVTAANCFSRVITVYKNHLDSISASTPSGSTVLTVSDFIDEVTLGNVEQALNNIRDAELKFSEKQPYLTAVYVAIDTHPYNSQEYNWLQQASRGISIMPVISSVRSNANIKYSNVKDSMGRTLYNAATSVDLSTISKVGLSPLEIGLLVKVKQTLTAVKSNRDFMTRGTKTSAYDNFDFSVFIPALDPDELTYVLGGRSDSSVYKFNNISPTTEVFFKKVVT